MLWLALRVSAGLTIIAALALVGWLADADANFLAIGSVVTAITVVTSVIVGVRTARHREFTDAFVWKMGVVTALLLLVVPASAVATRLIGGGSNIGDLAWSISFLLIFGFIGYRRMLNSYLDQLDSRATLWQVDRLALEILVLFLVMLVPLGVVTAGVVHLLTAATYSTSLFFECFAGLLACLFSVFGVPALGAFALVVFTQ